MKMNKKKVFALALAVCLIATLSMGSLAWFTDEDSVKNDFLIAGSENSSPDEVFSVDVWENTPDGDKDQDGHEYKDVLPGDSLKKEVVVENTGAYDQYIRVIVVVSNATQWQTVLGVTGTPELSQIVDGFDPNVWQPSGANYDAANNNFWYVLYGKDILSVDGTVEVFKTVEVPGDLTRDQAAAFAGGFEINVLAEAVQTENVGASAYEAFQTVKLYATDSYNKFIATNH